MSSFKKYSAIERLFNQLEQVSLYNEYMFRGVLKNLDKEFPSLKNLFYKSHAAIGIIINHDDCILIAKVPSNKAKIRMGNWEFPGGTNEAGETPEISLFRELKEEVGIEVVEFNKLTSYLHSQGNHESLLEVFVVTKFHGRDNGLEGQETHWINRDDFSNFKFTLSHQKIIKLFSFR
ncbi:MAG: NUDIX domain-containing protein [Gammaproteobacteria bacterium]